MFWVLGPEPAPHHNGDIVMRAEAVVGQSRWRLNNLTCSGLFWAGYRAGANLRDSHSTFPDWICGLVLSILSLQTL